MNGRLVLILLLLSGSMPLVLALDASYEVMPHSGPSDQQILVWVRTEPLIDTNHYVMYVFWDYIPIVERLSDIALKSGSYEHRWDIKITPPAGHNYPPFSWKLVERFAKTPPFTYQEYSTPLVGGGKRPGHDAGSNSPRIPAPAHPQEEIK